MIFLLYFDIYSIYFISIQLTRYGFCENLHSMEVFYLPHLQIIIIIIIIIISVTRKEIKQNKRPMGHIAHLRNSSTL